LADDEPLIHNHQSFGLEYEEIFSIPDRLWNISLQNNQLWEGVCRL
jgi:hypothetical protein